MAKQWRNAVVGVGVIGTFHARILHAMQNASLVAACDVDPKAATERLAKYGLEKTPVYPDLQQMLASETIDVVHICTPSGDHMDPAIFSMEAGKHVICEKPMEIQLDRIDRMIDASRKHGVKLAGIFQNRWNGANAALRTAAEQDRFGRIAFAGSYTPWFRTDAYYREGGWRGTWRLDGGGAIMNQSVHAVDLLQWIVGPVKIVSAYAGARIHAEIEVEDTLACSLQFENGAFGVIMGSTAMYPGSAVRIEVGGEHGTAVSESGLSVFKFREARPEDEELRRKLAPGGVSAAGATSNVDVALDLHFQNIEAILDAWERGEEASTNGLEARKAVAIILAMYESARTGGTPVAIR